VSNITDLFTSTRAELLARYQSPFWGPAVVAILVTHWKIMLYLAIGPHTATEAIAFFQNNVSASSIFLAVVSAIAYTAIFPWVELAIESTAAHGRRRRNTFQIQERQREIGRRKVIAQQQEKALEIELKNLSSQSKLADIELVKAYQAVSIGENLNRWLSDLERGPINSSLNNTIVNYLHKVDSGEGKFIDSKIEAAHATYVKDLSTLLSAINDSRKENEGVRKEQLVEFSKNAKSSHKAYRDIVREILGV
jgi:hypothetical protein